MKKGIKGLRAAAMAAVLLCAGHAGAAAPYSEGTTVVRERGAAEQNIHERTTGKTNIRERVAGIIGETTPPQNRVFAPGRSRMMRRWDVMTEDTGGTLLFSDSPEYVKESGILYRDTVEGDARVLYYHLNDTAQPKKVAVILETEANLAIVSVTRGGTSTPSTDYLRVGKATQIAYFDPAQHEERIYVAKERPRLLSPAMNTTVLAPGELVYGVYDFHANAPVRVSVVMYGADVDPFSFLRTARVLPRDEVALRGTFQNMDRVVTLPRAYDPMRDGAAYFPIGDNIHDIYRSGVDATDGTPVVNYGNYGILYHIALPITGRGQVRCFLSPLGGVYAGAVTAVSDGHSRLIETPASRAYFGDQTLPEPPQIAQARTEGLLVLTQYTELADLGTYSAVHPVTFTYSPPGASNLPVNIILLPE